MKQYAAVILLSAVSGLGASTEEECIFDQKAQKKAYLELQEKYQGSRYVEKEGKLAIPENGNEISLWRGGCVHFGIRIELKTPKTDAYEDESRLFGKVAELVSAYGRELMDPEKLRKQIRDRKWQAVDAKKGGFYFLQYEGLASVEIYRKHEAKYTVVGISYYF